MYKKMRWTVINFGILGMFIFGSLYGNSGLEYFSLGMLWLTAAVGTMAIGEDVCQKIAESILESDPDYKRSMPEIIDTTFDLFVVLVLAYFGHPILAIFYTLQMVGVKNLSKKIVQLQNKQTSSDESPNKEERSEEKNEFVKIKEY